MSTEIRFSEYALSDLAGIGDYIEFQLSSPQAANKALALILDAIQALSDFPENGVSVIAPDGFVTPYRVLICEKRYAISYIFDKETQKVWVYRVFHTIQDWLAFLLARSEPMLK
ncbi:MAG: type II toxin-antitoxin system RelE/ParE family toxin [Coriobacteriia bacterium]|nr:type II toxin-antitoxin system RelE/ParE family toxin [Coriobacteriia bacterium]